MTNKLMKAAAIATMLSVASFAFADAPVLNILTITGPQVVGTWAPGDDLTVNFTPTTVNVGGTVTHDPNLNPVQAVKLYVNDILQSSQVIPNGSGDTFPFSLAWTIPSAGDYTLKVTAKHGNCGDCTGFDEEILTVIDLGGGDGGNPGVDCKAAPAVAAALLKSHNVKPKVISEKNYISQVAHFMGPQTMFDDVAACDVDDYRAAVNSYLNTVLNAY